MTNTHSTSKDYLCENFPSAGYCHSPGCPRLERVWMSDEHVALADGMCSQHSHLTCSAATVQRGEWGERFEYEGDQYDPCIEGDDADYE